MTQAIVAKIPIFSPFLPKPQKTLAEKALSGAVLTAFERLQHLCLLSTRLYKDFYEAKASRIYQINDPYTKVYDTTTKGFVGVVFHKGVQTLSWAGHIFQYPLEGELMSLPLSNADGIDYSVVSDTEREGKLLISQKTIPADYLGIEYLSWISDVAICSITVIPPVFETRGWAVVVKTPEKIVRTHFVHPSCEFIVPTLTGEEMSLLPVDDSPLGEDRHLINRVLASSQLSEADSLQHEQLLGANLLYNSVFTAKKARVHSFREEGLKLLDCTLNGTASIKKEPSFEDEYIRISGICIDYPLCPMENTTTKFSPFYSKEPIYTEYFSVHDISGRNWVEIRRHISATPTNPYKTVKSLYIHLADSNVINDEAEGATFFGYAASAIPPPEIEALPPAAAAAAIIERPQESPSDDNEERPAKKRAL